MLVRACVCVCARVCECVSVCLCVCVTACLHMSVAPKHQTPQLDVLPLLLAKLLGRLMVKHTWQSKATKTMMPIIIIIIIMILFL